MSRIAITTLLAVGSLMGSAGTALGASALSTDTNAAAVQYGSATTPPVNLGQSAPDASAGQPVKAGGAAPDTSGPLPGANRVLSAQSEPETAAAQAPRQVGAQQPSELPFTGYAPIPILLIGLLLLGWGLMLRHRNAPQAAVRP